MFDLAKRNIVRVRNLKVSLKRQVKNQYDRCLKFIRHEESIDLKREKVDYQIEKVINSPLRIYNEKTKNIKAEIDADNEHERIELYLLFLDVDKFDISLIKSRIESVSHENIEISDLFEEKDTRNIFGEVCIGNEKIQIIGYDVPMPKEIVDVTIKFSHAAKEDIENMNNHNYHIVATYEGKSKDYNLIYNLYAKLAYGFLEYNFVGLANKYCYNVLAPSLINGLFEDEKIFEYASTPVMSVWRNLVEVQVDDGVWYITKGNSSYGIHEYAFKGSNVDYSKAHSIFNYLFNYEYLGRVKIKESDILEVGQEATLSFKSSLEIRELLCGIGDETLIIERKEK